MEFTGTLIDDSAEETKKFQLVEPDLNVEYKKPLSRPVPDPNAETEFLIP